MTINSVKSRITLRRLIRMTHNKMILSRLKQNNTQQNDTNQNDAPQNDIKQNDA